jgi:excisionase family DNA binding protein
VLAFTQARKEKYMKKLFSTKEVAEKLGIHPSTLGRWVVAGKVRYERVGISRAIPAEEIRRLLRERKGVKLNELYDTTESMSVSNQQNSE